jgi:hypothetical protein
MLIIKNDKYAAHIPTIALPCLFSLHAQKYCYCPIPRPDGQSSRIQCFFLSTKRKTTASYMSREDHLINSINHIDCLLMSYLSLYT